MRDAGTKVWRYEFGFGAPGTGKPLDHTIEMDYVYYAQPSTKAQDECPPVQRYWANFIRKGDPNSEGLPFWPTVGSRDSMLAIEPGGPSCNAWCSGQVISDTTISSFSAIARS